MLASCGEPSVTRHGKFQQPSVWAAAPAAPTGLRGDTSVPGEVTLSWDASPGATAYNVYRSADPLVRFQGYPIFGWALVNGAAPVANVSAPGYTDQGLPALVRQFYVVRAVNGEGESPFPPAPPPYVEVRVTAPPEAAKDMEAFIDGQPGGGWFKIATSAADARRIINGGGMAVVLGIEVDELFG